MLRPSFRGLGRLGAEHNLTGLSLDDRADDYGITALNMATSLRDVRRRLHVHTPSATQLNDNNRLLEAGCRKLGVSSRRFELNMRDCLECGFLRGRLRLRSQAGRDGDIYRRRDREGRQAAPPLRHRTYCDRENRWPFDRDWRDWKGRPTQRGSEPNSIEPGLLEVNAKLVIVAGGAIESPCLLQRSQHPDPHDRIGRGLVLHPSLPLIGVMDREISNYRGVSGSVYSDHFYSSHGFYFECMFGHPAYGAAVMPSFGPEHFEMMRLYRRLAGFGVMLVDSVAERNRVTWDVKKRRPKIDYQLADQDKQRMRFAAQKAIEVMFAAGAKEAMLASEEPLGALAAPRFRDVSESVHCRHLKFLPHQTAVTSAHPQATVKMGEEPRWSIVNSRGESHLVERLIVCDSSVFPTSCGANPMISIMTLARYQGRRIAAERVRYEL